ncbi:hypothetical protein KFK09_013376 [Dendrobium nobile]|uniref:Uncharacterized protein n=1 Tax=Dendrobium nobile TaxID=94219 RepID=A0A8T3B8K6_DENNO|nr:hypothetical protein KFK09_013376 [Dendrobium nobile]
MENFILKIIWIGRGLLKHFLSTWRLIQKNKYGMWRAGKRVALVRGGNKLSSLGGQKARE